MAVYWFTFTPNPATSSNLGPTFTNFIKFDGTTLTPPGITQLISGTGIYQFTYNASFSIAFLIDGATTGLQTSQRYISGNVEPKDNEDVLINGVGTSLIALAAQVSLGFQSDLAQGASSYAQGIGIGSSLTAIGSTTFADFTLVLAQGSSVFAVGQTTNANVLSIGSTLSVSVAGIGSTLSAYGGISLEPFDLYGYAKWIKEFLSGSQSFNKMSGQWSIYDRNFATLLAIKSVTSDVNGVTRG